MQVGHDVTVFSESIEQSISNVGRLQGAEPYPCQIAYLRHFVEQVG